MFFFIFVLYGQAATYTVTMLDFLPKNIKDALQYVNLQYVYELRLRVGRPTTINYKGKYRYLGTCGLTDFTQNAIVTDKETLENCVYCAGKFSVYSVEEQIKRGFLTTEYGERIGLAGQYVFDKGQPLTIRDFTSLCIRVPHEVIGCGEEIYRRCFQDGLKNVLIASPPGQGKTTILRDLSRILSQKTKRNVLICDERGELSVGEIGNSCDVLLYSDKTTAFEAGIRALRPDIMITDELSSQDTSAVLRAIVSGITVLASAHFSDMGHVQPPFLGIFDRYVFLDQWEIGKTYAIYDEQGRIIP